MAQYIDQAAQERAEAKFNRQEEKRRDAEIALAAYRDEQRAIEEKTARLRAARLAREAQEKVRAQTKEKGGSVAEKAETPVRAKKANGAKARDVQADIKAQAAAFAAATRRAAAAKARLGIKTKPVAREKKKA